MGKTQAFPDLPLGSGRHVEATATSDNAVASPNPFTDTAGCTQDLGNLGL